MKDKNIVYKVVGKRNKMGSNMNIFLDKYNLSFTKFKKKKPILWKELKQYFPQYKKGSVVESVPGSAGIMCFSSKKSANSFIDKHFSYRKHLVKIIEVLGCGKKRKKYKYIGGCAGNFRRLLDINIFDHWDNEPGWITYESVVVLE
jgi:hypothetical protein